MDSEYRPIWLAPSSAANAEISSRGGGQFIRKLALQATPQLIQNE